MYRKLIPILGFLFMFMASPSWPEEGATPIKAIYYDISEPFTINFLNQSNQKARYLQIKVSLMAYEQNVINDAQANLPMIQHALRTLFSEQSWDSVNSIDGRKALQATTLKTLKSILQKETGNNNLDSVYFTSFIIQ